MNRRATLLDLGRRSYLETLELQRDLHGLVARGEAPDTWVFVEHDPVVTLGRSAAGGSVLASPEALAAGGIDVVRIERGGDATYHGPGQLVVYPIVKLERFREVVPLVSALEASVCDALARFGIVARAGARHRGVYVGDKAICAIGLAVKQMTSLHGIALNVSTDLDYDRWIVPCGTPEFGITSMRAELGTPVSWTAARAALIASLGERFGVSFTEREAGEVSRSCEASRSAGGAVLSFGVASRSRVAESRP